MAEATASLAAAFKNLTVDQADALDELLLKSVASNRDAVRLCAVQWANRVFSTAHIPVSAAHVHHVCSRLQHCNH